MKHELTLGCDCAGTCTILLVMEWERDGDSPQESYFEMYEHIRRRTRWRDRLRVALAVVRGREPYTHGTAFIGSEKLVQLRDFLTECIDAEPDAAQGQEESHGG